MDIFKEINNFPTTRYQGSKRKILPWIYECLKDIEFNSVLDAFGGSGIVSYLFKKMGKSVTYNDILSFNHIIGKSIISNQEIRLTENDIDSILANQHSKKKTISNNFNNIYYHNEENIWIDNTIYGIENLNKFYDGTELVYKKSIALNALFQSCLIKRPYNLFHRKNLDMRIRDVKRNFGNKTTWETPFEKHYMRFINEINRSVFDSGTDCRSLNQDIFEIENINYDLVYIDSPYIKKEKINESSDYLRCYHFLEGIARYEEWLNIIDFDTINHRIKNDYIPNYFKPSQAISTFENIIRKFQNSIIVISYKYGGTPSVEELVDLILIYKNEIRVFDKHYKYALNKQNGNANLNREYILIGY